MNLHIPERVLVYAVMSWEEFLRLKGLLGHNFEPSRFFALDDLMLALEAGGSVPVVIGHEAYLMKIGADWKVLLERLIQLAHPPKLIVAHDHPDERVWAEILNLGGYDVVSWPPEPGDLNHILTSAWLAWKRE